MSEQEPEDFAASTELDDEEDLPELNEESDNDPDDSSPYVAGETQDPEATERPEVDKHPED